MAFVIMKRGGVGGRGENPARKAQQEVPRQPCHLRLGSGHEWPGSRGPLSLSLALSLSLLLSFSLPLSVLETFDRS
jgi:hypothetical protein